MNGYLVVMSLLENLNWNIILSFFLGHLGHVPTGLVIVVVADALVPKRCQAVSIYHADSVKTKVELIILHNIHVMW